MKKRIWMLILAAAMALVCLSAVGEEAQYVVFPIYIGTGETVAPDYPDYAGLIGEGLTKDDFDITYRVTGSRLTVDENGAITMSSAYTYDNTYNLYILYTPKVEGVGVETEFYCLVYTGNSLRSISAEPARVTIGLDQTAYVRVNSGWDHLPKDLDVTGYDERIVSAALKNSMPSGDSYIWDLNITPHAVGETTVTVIGYNGVHCDIPVKVMLPPTELTFSADEYTCYVGDKIYLGTSLGEGEHAANYSVAQVRYGHTYYGVTKYFPNGLMGYFTTDVGADYVVKATTYNGFSASATIHVYDRENVTRIAASADTLRVGESNIYLYTYDANGKKVRPQHLSITKGSDIVSIEEDWYATKTLNLLGVGEFELTVINQDGSICSQTFEIEPYPTEILLNAEEITLEIGESFGLEVGFDKGELPWSIMLSKQDVTDQQLATTRLEGNVITAQAPGTATYYVKAGTLTRYFTVTVPDSDKAVAIDMPEVPLSVGASYQLYVRDRTGEIYPAVFTTNRDNNRFAEITAGGYLTANEVNAGYEKLAITATLKDGRVLQVKDIEIIKRPKWLAHDALVIRKSNAARIVATSDVGNVGVETLTVKIANEKIVKLENGYLMPKSTGKTTVTITSKYDESVSTTFTVKVISDTSSIYIGSTTITVPCGSVRYLPIVTDEDGEAVPMKWEITHNNPGTGNAEKSGFVLDGDAIGCTWPDATCEVTGTVKGSNEYVVVTVKGYQLPTNVTMEPEQIWLEPGETQTVNLVSDDEYGGWGVTYWVAQVDGVVSLQEYVDGRSNTITAVAGGTTLVGAMLENGATAYCIVNVYDPEARLPGDVNEDGVVDEQDALIIMQYDAGWPVLINGWQGDVNADGNTNLADAILILQYDAGLDVQLKQYIPEE